MTRAPSLSRSRLTPVARLPGGSRRSHAAGAAQRPEFWTLVTESSEPDGYFRNREPDEPHLERALFQYVIPELVEPDDGRAASIWASGPEQNFTYMAAVRPRLAIIFDIRRGNLDLQLMYKALFELSRDRAEFVVAAVLQAAARRRSARESSAADDLRARSRAVPASEAALQGDAARRFAAHLTETHALPLPADDLRGHRLRAIERFYWSGFAVRPSPTYADLMTATDAQGRAPQLPGHRGELRCS